MCAPTPISTTPSRTSSTARSSTPARAAAASSASTSTRDVYDRFVAGFVENARGWTLGNPLDPDDHRRPDGAAELRRPRPRADRRGAAQGRHARTSTRSTTRDEAGSPYLAPEVLTDVNHQMAVMREESFGPVVGIMKVADDDEAITLMNDSPYGLTASIWTAGPRRRGAARRAGRDRHGLRQPLRLSRSGAGLDRRQGHRQGRRPERDRLRQPHAAQELSSAAGLMPRPRDSRRKLHP